MSNRCPDCGKLASLELSGEVEIEDEQNSGDGSGTITARIVRNSACCGTEMKDARFDLEFDLSDDYRQHWEDDHDGADHMSEPELEIDLEEDERTVTTSPGRKRKDGTRGPDRPIKSRYWRSYFGVRGTVTVKCGDCGAEIGVVELSDEVPASGMDELN